MGLTDYLEKIHQFNQKQTHAPGRASDITQFNLNLSILIITNIVCLFCLFLYFVFFVLFFSVLTSTCLNSQGNFQGNKKFFFLFSLFSFEQK